MRISFSLSECLHHDPVGLFVQDLCMEISCPKPLFQDLCAKNLWDHLCKIFACGLLHKIFVSGSPQQDPVRLLVQDHCVRSFCALHIFVYFCIKILCDHVCMIFAWELLSKITLLGCLHPDPLGLLVQDLRARISCAKFQVALRSMDMPDLRSRNRNFTRISRDGRARSLQRVALGNRKPQLYQHFARWTRTIRNNAHPQ